MKNILFLILIAANLGEGTLFAAPGAWTDDGLFSLSTGFDNGSGKYGITNSSDMLSTPVAGEYESGHLMINVAIPYVQIFGPIDIAPRVGQSKGKEASNETYFGLGDALAAAASYNLYYGRASTFGVDLTGKVKLNTTVKSLGSVQNDYAAQADAYQSFNKFTALGSMGYKVLSIPTGISMNKVLYGSFGGAYQLDDNTNGGVDLNLSQNPSISGEGHRELSAYVSHKISKNFKAKGYVLKGFSNGSPDSSLGAQVYYGF